jgi:hypothetical protein
MGLLSENNKKIKARSCSNKKKRYNYERITSNRELNFWVHVDVYPLKKT